MIDRPTRGGERAILVHVNFAASDVQEDLAEFHNLAASASAKTVATITASRQVPEAKYFVGSGKAEEIREAVAALKADLVLINHPLTPAQERNLEKLCECRVLDRTGLILDIFAQRARTFEGQLQVELAQLQHLSTRLVRGWLHLERQKGGIGLRGPGEKQLETDRRLIRVRIGTIKKRLEKVRRQRSQSRRARQRFSIPTVSLVGYTNAGKSTLFNRLTGAQVFVADQLFATLDPTLRHVQINKGFDVVLADTVGFIRHLPHDLIEAFRATLEETRDSALLLHIIDAHAMERNANIEQVEYVLDEIGAKAIPVLQVFNKIDLMKQVNPRVDRDENGMITRVWLSAATGDGMELLEQALAENLDNRDVYQQVRLTPEEGRLRALLYEKGAVITENFDENGDSVLEIRLSNAEYQRLFNK